MLSMQWWYHVFSSNQLMDDTDKKGIKHGRKGKLHCPTRSLLLPSYAGQLVTLAYVAHLPV